MKTLITGGLGFIGSALTQGLVRQGDTVRVLDNSSRGSKEKLADAAASVEIIEGDIRDPRLVRKAVAGMDRVLHLAFVNGTEFFYQYPDYVLDVGVKGMVNVLDACIQESVREFVLASSSEVYQTPPTVPTPETAPLSIPDPLNPRYSYGGGKIISELMAINYGRAHFERVLIFRPHNVYGPNMGWEHVIPQFVGRMKQLSRTDATRPLPFPIQGSGAQTRSFIYIDDFTNGLLLALEKGKHLEIYHIGTQEEISIKNLAERIAGQMDLTINVIPGPEAPGGTLRRCPDTRKLQSLGFTPAFALENGLAKTVQWYRDHAAPAPGPKAPPSLFFLS